jgi:DNA polymerase-1
MTQTQTNPQISLKEIDLVSLIERETGLRYRRPVGKDQVAKGPCPWCGGVDRFGIVLAEQPQRFYCGWHGNGCGRRGTAFSFLRLWRDLSEAEACAFLRCVPPDTNMWGSDREWKGGTVPQDEGAPAPPPARWQETGRRLLAWSQQLLWEPRGAPARTYLRQRGLSEETIRRLGLGYLPKAIWSPFPTWGLPAPASNQRMFLPVGIVIPYCSSDGILWKLVIRRLGGVARARARYLTLPGSVACLYRAETLAPGRPALVAEGELDVASAEQALGQALGQVACVGTGGTGGARTAYWLGRLAQAEPVLVAFDRDVEDQGERAASSWLQALGGRAMLWLPPAGVHDLNDLLVQRGEEGVRVWVQTGVELAQGLRQWHAQSPAQSVLPPAVAGRTTGEAQCQAAGDSGGSEERCSCGELAHWVAPDGRPCCGRHVLPWDLTPLVQRGAFTFAATSAQPWAALVRRAGAEETTGAEQPAPPSVQAGSIDEGEAPTPLETAAVLLSELAAALQAGSAWVGLDGETTGLNPRRDRLITITFGQPGRVFLLDLRRFWAADPEEQARWKREIQALFALLEQAAETTLTWVGHHLKFDWQFLAQLGFFLVRPGSAATRLYDTMLVEQVLQNGRDLPCSLEAAAQRYGIAVHKEERAWFMGLDQRPAWQEPLPELQLRYLVQDVLVPLAIAAQQQERIRQAGVERIVQLEHDALPIVAEMERHGVLLDQVSWQRLARRQQERLERIEADLTATLGTIWTQWKERQEPLRQPLLLEGAARFSLHSLQQVREALEVVCGTPLSGLSEEALAPFADRAEVQEYLKWRKLQHWCTTFGVPFLRYVEEDGRIHADFRQVGARSGRIICQTPNLQQIPRRSVGEPGDAEPEEEDEILVAGALRRCFVAPPGAKLLTVDLANIELRILAECAHDERMLTAFAEGRDLHSETARLVFGLPEEADPRRERWGVLSMREVAKTVNFGLLYGMGPASLARRVGVSLEEARLLMGRFFAAYPRVSSWLQRVSRQALRRGEARTLGGRVRWFKRQQAGAEPPGLLERAARNHPIQGTNADILKQALALLWQRLPVEVHVVLVVHDELVLECPNERVEEAICVLQQSLMDACREWLPTVALPEPEVCCAPWWRK